MAKVKVVGKKIWSPITLNPNKKVGNLFQVMISFYLQIRIFSAP